MDLTAKIRHRNPMESDAVEADARAEQAFDGAIAEFVGSVPFQNLLGG